MTAEQTKRSILLVDDDANDRELAQIVFAELASESGERADVRILPGGQEALDFLVDQAERPEQLPDVVLLDLNMPQIDGLSVLKAIRQNPAMSTLPVVILSTSRERADVQRAYSLGANAYVVKPLDYDHFHRTISSVLDFWTGQNQVNR
ncbi:response regulator [Deinococcus piscis]|uniref:Response regulator n=1 Tax=Deinococcus piscis TaxID=394230 RepID=A0ABQ3K4R5_9DEIO|nr:response regulator [Deinococcus piscis]GHG02071.1 response regulator [Deinococcus piscis]